IGQLELRQHQEQQSALLNAFVESAGYGIYIADALQPGTPLIYVNPSFQRLTGYTAAEVLGRNISLLEGPDTDPAARAQIYASVTAGQECRVTIRNYRKDGTSFWNDLRISPIRDLGGR